MIHVLDLTLQKTNDSQKSSRHSLQRNIFSGYTNKWQLFSTSFLTQKCSLLSSQYQAREAKMQFF